MQYTKQVSPVFFIWFIYSILHDQFFGPDKAVNASVFDRLRLATMVNDIRNYKVVLYFIIESLPKTEQFN